MAGFTERISVLIDVTSNKAVSGLKDFQKSVAEAQGFTGKLKAGVAGKRHRLISHNAKYIRQNRGTKVMTEADAKIIRIFLPYGL